MSEEATVAEAKAASTGTSGEALLLARGIVKDYYSVMRDDAGWAPWLLHRVFGFAGAYRDSPKLWEPRPVLRGVDVTFWKDGEVVNDYHLADEISIRIRSAKADIFNAGTSRNHFRSGTDI